MNEISRANHRLVDNIFLFWGLLTLPAVYLLVRAAMVGKSYPLLEWTGDVSVWLLIATMMVTPLQMAFGALPWLRVRRRHLGVASFAYGALHLAVWLAHANPTSFLRSFVRPEILPGWIGLIIMAALAAISTDRAVRRLGPRWKAIQRWVYLAALLSLGHWIFTSHDYLAIALYCGPILAFSGWRLARRAARS